DKVVCALPVDNLTDKPPKYRWPLQDRNEYLKQHSKIERPTPATTSGVNLGLPEANRRSLANVLESEKTTVGDAWSTLTQQLPALMQLPVHASKEPLTRHYCSTVQGNTISGCQTPLSSAAAVIRLDSEYLADSGQDPFAQNSPAIALVAGCQEKWIELDPLHGAAQSTLLLARSVAASGGKPLAMTDCLNFGSPKQPAVMRQISDAIDGINSVATSMHIPIVSGNVSLNNQTGTTPIPPTPMVGIVGLIDSVKKVIGNNHAAKATSPKTQANTAPASTSTQLYWLAPANSETLTSFAMSEMAWNVFLANNGPVPAVDFNAEKHLWECVHELHSRGILANCSVVGCGGLMMTLATIAAKANSAFVPSANLQSLSTQKFCAEGQAGVVISGHGLNDAALVSSIERKGLKLISMGELRDFEALPAAEAQLWKASAAAHADSLKSFFG
ncbi:MAG: AIR synthase related protein, partial [Silvanigrellaceae bacterium]